MNTAHAPKNTPARISSLTLIRPIRPEDEAQWRPLWLAYQDFYEVKLEEAVTCTTFQRFFKPEEPLFAAVSVQGDTLVGLVHLVLHRSTWATRDFCYLEDLYLTPASRGTGAGQQLIEWAQDFARKHTCARLYWHTHATNLRAQTLYNRVAEKSGFIEYRMPLSNPAMEPVSGEMA